MLMVVIPIIAEMFFMRVVLSSSLKLNFHVWQFSEHDRISSAPVLDQGKGQRGILQRATNKKSVCNAAMYMDIHLKRYVNGSSLGQWSWDAFSSET